MESRSINIPAQLDKLANDRPIPLESVDFTVKDSRQLRTELGPALNYFGRVEREVERNVLELQTLLPDADDNTRRFYTIWEAQEVPHGLIFEKLEQELDMQPAALNLNQLSRTIKLGGMLSHLPKMQDILMHSYLVTGAQHERLTANGYRLLKSRLLRLGERAIVETAIDPIMSQEAKHFAYYKNAALLQKDHLSDWQLHLSRILRTATYAPVGAGNKQQKAAFGHTAEVLLSGDTRDERLDEFAEPIQKVAQELLVREENGLILPRFVVKSLRESIELHREQQRQ